MSDDDRFNHEPGPRRSALDDRRKTIRRRRTFWQTFSLVGAIAVASALALVTARQIIMSDPAPTPAAEAEPSTVTTTLLFGTDEERDGSQRVAWITLLVHDRDEDRGAVAYIPARTSVEVPGRGLQSLTDAYETGQIPLLLITTENLLGVSIDRYVELSPRDARLFLTEIAPLVVDVPHEVSVSAGPDQTRTVLGEGLQRLPEPFLVRLLYTLGTDGDEISLGSRHIAFWDALFETFQGDGEAITAAVESASGAFATSDEAAADFARFLADLVSLHPDDRSIRALPVSSLQISGSELYVADADEVTTFVSEVVGASATSGDEVRVQILNGNGEPGIGEEVASRLVGEGFRVILSGNARSLDHAETLIITYDDSSESRALAERARDLLGVGEVQVSTQEQGIVDLTIVVGKDFLRTR